MCNIKTFVFTFSGILKEIGGGLKLTENWARSFLKSINWIKRKDTTGKLKPCKMFLEEEKVNFQWKIPRIILDHDIPSEIVLNLDQTPLLYALGKVCILIKGDK